MGAQMPGKVGKCGTNPVRNKGFSALRPVKDEFINEEP
jgi:hypothetical protein